MTTITNDYYDVIVIGTGPAGFACAVRSAQLGLKTACINNRHDANNKDTHLNTGDIGTMALLDSAKKYHSLIHEYAEHGIYAKDIKLDLTIMLQRKDKILAEIGNKMIDLFQIMTAFLTLGLYTTIVCYFFYRLNEKSIDKLEERMDKNETHWREMFMYMNDRIGTKGQ